MRKLRSDELASLKSNYRRRLSVSLYILLTPPMRQFRFLTINKIKPYVSSKLHTQQMHHRNSNTPRHYRATLQLQTTPLSPFRANYANTRYACDVYRFACR